uniref:Selenoprotein O n=2 Tax=Macaca fascicularis TaxID=9541 RepID=A0A7N9IHR6_MACFA
MWGRECETWGSEVAECPEAGAVGASRGGFFGAGSWLLCPASSHHGYEGSGRHRGAHSLAGLYLGTRPGADKGYCVPWSRAAPGPLPLLHSHTVLASAAESSSRAGRQTPACVQAHFYQRLCRQPAGVCDCRNWAMLEAHEAPDVTWDGRFSGTCELLTLHAFPPFRVLPGILVLGDSCPAHVVNSVFGFRQADGRKVLRSSIREFLCSEAMFHLGVPTTRAGACVTSESTVVRDVFYDGNPKYEQCTVVLRIASTFIRFGSFEIFKSADEHTGRAGPSVGRNDIRVQLLDYVISSFYPEIQAAHASDRVQRNAAFFREVTRRTAWMVAEWQCVGFCHGVLNTDNMSILGLTIDYGPFGFLDRYDPDHVCNASDNTGRYAYSKQPEVCKWNLQKLAEALQPELPLELGEAILAEEFDAEFQRHYMQKMRRKLGLVQLELEEDRALVSKLLETMHLTGADFTNTFFLLSSFPVELESPGLAEFLARLMEQCASLEELRLAFRPQMDPRQLSMMLMLAQSNPQLFALMGTRAGIARELERVEQQSRLEQLSMAELQSRNQGHWADWLQAYRARLDKDLEGAGDAAAWQAERVRVMHANNPKYVLRNYIAQNAIEAAERGDFSEVRRVLKLLENPYHCEAGAATDPEATEADGADGRQRSYSSKPPLWAAELCVT